VNDLLTLEHKPNGYTDDELTTVRIVTLPEYAHECAIRRALINLETDKDLNMVGASDMVDAILQEQFKDMKEFVYIDDNDEIIVGVNRVTVDDAAVTYGLKLLFEVETIEPGYFQQFGEWIPLNWC
jgi:hypothetical protein